MYEHYREEHYWRMMERARQRQSEDSKRLDKVLKRAAEILQQDNGRISHKQALALAYTEEKK